MHPISKKHFGKTTGKMAVKFYDGSTVVTGQIIKQIGSYKFRVAKIDGTGTKDCALAQTANQLTALTAGTGPDAASRASLCTIEVAIFGGGTENIKSIYSVTARTIQGTKVQWKLGVAADAAGKGTIALVANAPTVANAIPNQAGTVAGAFSYVIPANTFADANGDTLTYTCTLVGGAAVGTIGFAFDASTRTLSKAAGQSTVGTKSFRVTASDGALSVFDDFDVVLS